MSSYRLDFTVTALAQLGSSATYDNGADAAAVERSAAVDKMLRELYNWL
jgi:hypothetical protein